MWFAKLLRQRPQELHPEENTQRMSYSCNYLACLIQKMLDWIFPFADKIGNQNPYFCQALHQNENPPRGAQYFGRQRHARFWFLRSFREHDQTVRQNSGALQRISRALKIIERKKPGSMAIFAHAENGKVEYGLIGANSLACKGGKLLLICARC